MSSFKEQLDKDLTDVFFRNGIDANGNDVSEFAETFIYRPVSGAGPYSITGIFDASTELVTPSGNNAKIETKYIRIMLKESDIIEGVKRGDHVVIREKLYGLAEPPESDGVGVVTLTLQKVADIAPSP